MDKLTQAAIKAHNVDVPIMKTRLVGNRLEMYLYGGRVITYNQNTPINEKLQPDDSPIALKELSLDCPPEAGKRERHKGVFIDEKICPG